MGVLLGARGNVRRSMAEIMQAIQAAGQYKDKKTGEMKTKWHKIGAAFPDDKGGYRLNLEVPPVPKVYMKDGSPVLTYDIVLRPFDNGPGGQGSGQAGGSDDPLPF